VRDDDRRALLDGWFRAYADRVLAYLQHRTDPQTAQDVLQEVFVTAFRKAGEVPEPPIGWLFGTARRLLANKHRGHRRHDQLIDRLLDDASREPDADLAEVKEAFLQTLATLSPADREVLTLTGWYDLTPSEAAAALGCTASAYAVRLHRARKRLAVALDEAGYRGDTPAGQFAEALRG
jgi:RNA polymerase sigma-70 factor (ECF subfamily)